MTRVLLCLSHSIEEYDQLRLLSGLGYEVASIGGYIDPRSPHDGKRPALPEVAFHPEVQAAVDALGTPDNLGVAQSRIPDGVLDWLGDDGVIIYHHYLGRLFGQWDRLRDWQRGSAGRRIIWRTVGQSVENNEREAAPYRADGLEIIRYSPKERNIPGYVGEDALIRFYKDPADYGGWTGEWPGVINITQHLRQREPYTNWSFWNDATRGLARPSGADDGPPPPFALPLGPGSEVIGGPGELTYDEMRAWLRRARCYLYTGTQPASYTLGLIEAMMTGIPVVSIPWHRMSIFPYGPDLFEGPEICGLSGHDAEAVRERVDLLLHDAGAAADESERQYDRAIELFGREAVGAQWKAFLR